MNTFSRWTVTGLILIALFITSFTLGLLWGGFGKVMAHGVVICLDCIGLI